MPTDEFLRAPWARGSSHEAFEESSFNIRPAPEFATGEVVMASLYRASGFESVSEKSVPASGRELDKEANRARRREAGSGQIQPDTWRTVLDRVIQSPKVAQQSSRRFLSLSPIVPDVSIYSGSARLTGNAWNPGQLVQRMIQLGASSEVAAKETWTQLHNALSVGNDDDVWARWLESEFEGRRQGGVEWKPTKLDDKFRGLPAADRGAVSYPARQFVIDLQGIIDAKETMTRRQWVSLMESVLRIGTVSHVVWLCGVNDRLWRVIAGILGHGEERVPSNRAGFIEQVLAVRPRTLSYGNLAIPTLRDCASRYLSARLGINRILWALAEVGTNVPRLESIDDYRNLVDVVQSKKKALVQKGVLVSYFKLLDQEARTINCKKGIGSNLIEFCQYTLGQRQTLDPTLRGYDQGYFLKKRGSHRAAPWVLSPGPVAILAMAHCCLHEARGPRSVQRLASHLAHYGIECDINGLNASELGRQLRMLGLVLDSPDAESGMLLVPPFSSKDQQT